MKELYERLAAMKPGILLALVTLLYGFGLGGAFGAFEDCLNVQGEAVLDSAYAGDTAALKKVTDKSWVYFKRAHLHANALGTTALALILLMAAVSDQRALNQLTALSLGLGALGYGLFWLLAGLSAPGMGSTAAAKKALQWLAVPSSGLCMLGLLVVTIVVVRRLHRAGA